SIWQAVELAVTQNAHLPGNNILNFEHLNDLVLNSQPTPTPQPQDTSKAISNLNMLLNDPSVMAVVGPNRSYIAHAEIPTLQTAANPFALISPSTTKPCLTRSSVNGFTVPPGLVPPCDFPTLHPFGETRNFFFRVVANDYIEGRALA